MEADKKRIWVSGQLVEVSEEVYTAYMKGDRKIRYFESDLKTERTILDKDGHVIRIIPSREDSLDRLMDDNAAQFADQHESVEDEVFRKLSIEQLYKALARLNEAEQRLVYALFFSGQTEQQFGQALGITQQAVHKQKDKILRKLKFFLES